VVGPVLFDNGTLSNFACVGRLDLLETRYGYRSPHWTREVHREATTAVQVGVGYMQAVLDANWLGEPLGSRPGAWCNSARVLLCGESDYAVARSVLSTSLVGVSVAAVRAACLVSASWAIDSSDR